MNLLLMAFLKIVQLFMDYTIGLCEINLKDFLFCNKKIILALYL